jgi:hypothetical protein
MPTFDVRTVPLVQLKINGNKGFAEPLCNSCTRKDCENPIEYRDVTVVATKKRMRVWVTGTRISFVADCRGYCA